MFLSYAVNIILTTKAITWSDCHVTVCIGLRTVFQAIIFSRMAFALTAWGLFTTHELLNKIVAFLKRSHRYGSVSSLAKIQPLLDSATETYLERCSLPIPSYPSSSHQTDLSAIYTWPEVLIFELPRCSLNVHKRSFIINCLFKFIDMWTCF